MRRRRRSHGGCSTAQRIGDALQHAEQLAVRVRRPPRARSARASRTSDASAARSAPGCAATNASSARVVVEQDDRASARRGEARASRRATARPSARARRGSARGRSSRISRPTNCIWRRRASCAVIARACAIASTRRSGRSSVGEPRGVEPDQRLAQVLQRVHVVLAARLRRRLRPAAVAARRFVGSWQRRGRAEAGIGIGGKGSFAIIADASPASQTSERSAASLIPVDDALDATTAPTGRCHAAPAGAAMPATDRFRSRPPSSSASPHAVLDAARSAAARPRPRPRSRRPSARA